MVSVAERNIVTELVHQNLGALVELQRSNFRAEGEVTCAAPIDRHSAQSSERKQGQYLAQSYNSVRERGSRSMFGTRSKATVSEDS